MSQGRLPAFVTFNYLYKRSKRYAKVRCCELLNFLLQLSKHEKGMKASERVSQGDYHFPDVVLYSTNITKNKLFVSLVVISAFLVHLLGHWFNSH